MIFLAIALRCEAAAFLRHSDLKADQQSLRFPIYRGADITVAITGVGKVRAAMAVVNMLRTEPIDVLRRSVVANIGLCGASRGDYGSRGDLIVINQVIDHGSRRRYYPDMLLQHDLPEAEVETFDTPVVTPDAIENGVVDMEAAGFFEAASRFVSPDRILIVKMISDFLAGERVSPDWVEQAFAAKTEPLAVMLRQYHDCHRNQASSLPGHIEDDIRVLAEQLRLTATQRCELRKLAVYFVLNGGESIAELGETLDLHVTSKVASKAEFAKLIAAMSAFT